MAVRVKVLVTGGSGFIGSHLVPELVARDYEVTILDNFVTGTRPSGLGKSKLVNHVEGSILDENLVTNLISKADEVVHLAAAVGVANIIDSPLRGIQTNVFGSEIVIRNCARQGKPLLLTSSSEIYGKNNNGPLNEDSDRIVGVPQKQRWSYSDSKAIEEALAIAYSKEVGLPLKIVRLFNTVGPGQKSEYGMVIPRFIRSALSDTDIEIYGDGMQTRCFMHVKDAVEGILKIFTSQDFSGEVFNLGNPQEIQILELAKIIKQETGSGSKIVFCELSEVYGEGFEDMSRRFPDISKARKLLRWEPQIGLQQIIKDSVMHFREIAR